jgi:galactose mutarotase-like enzyme
VTTILEIDYRGRKAIAISSQGLRAVFFLDFGAKLVSLQNLQTGYEFLRQGKEHTHPVPQYGRPYIENDLCGADDIFPSINPSYYPAWPWKGTECPPHGELWSIPWRHSRKKDVITFQTHGIRFPYSFQRSVRIKNDTILHFDYRIMNHSPFPMAGIWALHPLFNAGADARLELPMDTKELVNTLNFSNRLGKVGSIHSWPETKDKYGKKYRLDRFEPDSGVCEKFFCCGKVREGYASLIRKEPGSSLTLRFPPETVPYLGIWKNQGGLLGQNNIALEPATGALDDIYTSSMWEECSEIPGNGETGFWVEFEVF